MPYKIDYLNEGGVITTYSGELTEEEFLQCTQDKFKDLERLHDLRYSISDFTSVTKFTVDLESIKENAMLSSHALQVNKRGVMAVVVNSALLHGLGNLWRGNSGDTEGRVAVFQCRTEAEEWVGKKLAEMAIEQD